jgi:hypothetical protein
MVWRVAEGLVLVLLPPEVEETAGGRAALRVERMSRVVRVRA